MAPLRDVTCRRIGVLTILASAALMGLLIDDVAICLMYFMG